jgi:hypothetical protein
MLVALLIKKTYAYSIGEFIACLLVGTLDSKHTCKKSERQGEIGSFVLYRLCKVASQAVLA